MPSAFMVSPDADIHNDNTSQDGRRTRGDRADAAARSGSGSASTAPGRAQRGSESEGRRREPERSDPERTPDGPEAGLVICAKNVRDQLADGVATGELRALDALGLRFPSPEMVTTATALFEPAAPWARGHERRDTEPESGRFRISVGPGVVRLAWTNPVRSEKTVERTSERHKAKVDAHKAQVKDIYDRARQLEPDAVVALAQRNSVPASERGHGAVITEWSRKSRSAMCRTFAELDYTPLVDFGRIPAMVTLTYPGDWEAVAPDGASVKRHMVLWRKRFHREYDEPARYIWKLEFQRRGAPHIHLWMAPPTAAGRSGRNFRQWLSETWAEIVDHPDPEQLARHRLAGTAIDILNGLKACDRKRLAIYFTKHSSPNLHSDKEYQHIVPEPWRQPGKRPGRFWGVFGLKKTIGVVEISQDAYLAARRIVRRWSRSQGIHGDAGSRFPTAVMPRTAIRMVPRVDSATGAVTHRKVRRRRALCSHGGLTGGYALVNNGPGFATQLARAIDPITDYLRSPVNL